MSGRDRTRLTEPADPGVVRLVRLENRSGSASKFYSPIIEEDPGVPGAFRCRAEYGRIGAAITSLVKATGSALTCERALDELVREKQRGGYTLILDERGKGTKHAVATTESEPPPAESTPAAPRAASSENLGDQLERRRREAIWAF